VSKSRLADEVHIFPQFLQQNSGKSTVPVLNYVSHDGM